MEERNGGEKARLEPGGQLLREGKGKGQKDRRPEHGLAWG